MLSDSITTTIYSHNSYQVLVTWLNTQRFNQIFTLT